MHEVHPEHVILYVLFLVYEGFADVRRYNVNFVSMVLPGDDLTVMETHNTRGEKVIQGSAEVAQPTSLPSRFARARHGPLQQFSRRPLCLGWGRRTSSDSTDFRSSSCSATIPDLNRQIIRRFREYVQIIYDQASSMQNLLFKHYNFHRLI